MKKERRSKVGCRDFSINPPLRNREQGTPTPSFPVERQKEALRVFASRSRLKEHIKSLVYPIFLQEQKPDTMIISDNPLVFAWRPNNYRLRIPFFSNIDTKQEIKGVVSLFPVELSKKGIGYLKQFKENITLQINPSCVVAIYSLKKAGVKAWYSVKANSIEDFGVWLDNKVLSIEDACLTAVKALNLSLNYQARVWTRHEDGVKNEAFLDSLPMDMIIQDTYFKKVYKNESEFKSPFYVKNYISNRAIESISPEIIRELSDLKRAILLNNPFEFVRQQYKGVEDILPGGVLFEVWRSLSDEEKNILINEV